MVLARIVSLSLSIYLFITPHTLSSSSFHMSLYGLFGNSTSASQNTVSIFDIINIVHSKYPSIHLSLSRSFFLSALWLKGHVCFVCHLNRSRVQISDEIHTKTHTHTSTQACYSENNKNMTVAHKLKRTVVEHI